MHRLLIFILFTAIAPFCLNAQQSDERQSPLRIGSMSVSIGGSTNLVTSLQLNDFRLLAPQSELLHNDLTDFEIVENYLGSSNFVFSAMMGIDFLNKKTNSYGSGPQLRIGFNYLSNGNPAYHLSRSDRTRLDTLESSQSGNMLFTDSIHEQEYNMNYKYDQIQIDLSFIYRTQTKSLLSLYAGLGVSAGLSLMSSTEIDYYSHNYTSNHGMESDNFYRSRNSPRQERFENSATFSMLAYIPIGAELRMGRERALWNQLYLFTELRPGLSYVQMSDMGLERARAWYQQTVGFRYRVLN